MSLRVELKYLFSQNIKVSSELKFIMRYLNNYFVCLFLLYLIALNRSQHTVSVSQSPVGVSQHPVSVPQHTR